MCLVIWTGGNTGTLIGLKVKQQLEEDFEDINFELSKLMSNRNQRPLCILGYQKFEFTHAVKEHK